MRHIAFHKDHREGVLDYQVQRVLTLGYIYAYDPYLGNYLGFYGRNLRFSQKPFYGNLRNYT